MIEKIMKAVKSNNKKRGRNITVGAVVGMLLSCTVAMGEDTAEVSGIEITKNPNGNIEFKDKSGDPFTPESEDEKNPYPDNNWNASTNTYTNNSVISGKREVADFSSEVREAALKVTAPEINLVNNGVIENEITVKSDTGDKSIYGYGIYVDSDLNGNLTNNGEIVGIGTVVYGIFVKNLAGELTNNGAISGTGSIAIKGIICGHGIHVKDLTLTGKLTNNGAISGTAVDDIMGAPWGYGIRVTYLEGELTNNGEITGTGTKIGCGMYTDFDLTGSLTNNGVITADNAGIRVGKLAGELTNNGVITSNVTGILLSDLDTSIYSNLTNTGIAYGKTNAIRIYDDAGTLKDLYNYGLLVVDKDGTIIKNSSKVEKMHNYGLAFKVDDNTKAYSAIEGDFSNFGTISTEGEYIVVNAKADGNYDNITGTDSLTLEEGKLTYLDSEGNEQTERISPDKKYVFNGITNTLKVSGKHNKLNNSRVNAYETAVVMNEGNSALTLDNTVVNGGMKENTTTISITKDGSALTVKGDSVINVRDGGVAIAVDGDDNAVVLKGNTIVNGKMEAKGERNILDLDGTGKDGMNMHHDIIGFEKMAIDNNVTFSEDMKVTGTTEVKVEETGVLSLRLKKDLGASASVDDTPKATHAFLGTGGMTIEGSGEGGTLNFITNGIGREILVDMKKIKLENMKIKASSIIDKAEIQEDYIRLGAGSALGEIVNPKEV
ncbi:autotransporter domain-containing protein, partial [Fusobacterium ulcerans]|nr:autotransporter domain-containing protein [Fusobacterium ulcerans]